MFDLSKLESLRDVNVTRIGDALSYDFPQTGMSPTQRMFLEDNNLCFVDYSNFTINCGLYKNLHHIPGLLQIIK